MPSFNKVKLSGSTSGKGIKIANTSTTLHTATSGANNYDEVWLWGYNSHTASVLVTVEFGGTTDPDEIFAYTIPADDGLHLLCPGLVLNGGLVVSAKGATTNVVTVFGYVNRIVAVESV